LRRRRARITPRWQLGGKVFEDRPWIGLLLALGLGLAISLLIEAARRVWQWRAADQRSGG
jgi:hypothetical protein